MCKFKNRAAYLTEDGTEPAELFPEGGIRFQKWFEHLKQKFALNWDIIRSKMIAASVKKEKKNVIFLL